jgi:hypothetical protein
MKAVHPKREGPMASSKFVKPFLACAMSIAAHASAAEVSDIDLLTCNVGSGMQPFPSAYWDHLHYVATPEGGFVVPGPIRAQGLCIQNANIAAGFGVYMVVGELCNLTPQPLFDWLAKNRPSLPRSKTDVEPRLLAAFRNQKESVSIFYGRASLQSRAADDLRQDTKERQLSYACSLKGSGPQ